MAAKAIRSDLKILFPDTKFRVTSKNYSGGDSINVSYIATKSTPSLRRVEGVVAKYEEGIFDGMTDMYDYKPRSGRAEFGAKYIFVHADTRELEQQNKDACMKYWGLQTDTDAECNKVLGMWFQQALYKFVRKNVLAWD